MIDTVFEMLSYPFMVRACVVGILVSLCSALLGVSLVLKRYSMIGDGLSHVGFGALAVAAALNAAPLTVAIPVVVTAAVLLLRVSANSKIKGDAAIALISTSALAVGIMVISRTTGMTADVDNYMFGSVLAMSWGDVALSAVLCAAVLCNQAVTSMMGEQLLGRVYTSREELAMDIENSGIMLAGLIPWSIACSIPLAMLGAGNGAILYAFLLWLIPICYLGTKKKFLHFWSSSWLS